MELSEADRAIRRFINEQPLYAPFVIRPEGVGGNPPDRPRMPASILRHCQRCDSGSAWVLAFPTNEDRKQNNRFTDEIASYICGHCGKETLTLWFVHEAHEHNERKRPIAWAFTKIGQNPSPQRLMDRDLAEALGGEIAKLYRKGLTSIAHGFGIGAQAYFRRVLEESCNVILEMFAQEAKAAGDLDAETRIRDAMTNRQMDERLKEAARALPSSLRPGNANPLKFLYDHYSRGIHRMEESDCLDAAQRLDWAMTYIFKGWRQQMQEARAFREVISEDPYAEE